MTTLGVHLVKLLEAHGVTDVFGIPGVHTIEMYRGLAASSLKHHTPRHEQGAGFMADGYARASGKPGVAFLITGPGITNAITAMAQAKADSVPMLVIASVNPVAAQGKGLGYLHETPDQFGLVSKAAHRSERVERAEDLVQALQRIFDGFLAERPGPAYLEIPRDLLGQDYQGTSAESASASGLELPDCQQALETLKRATKPLIIAGGGAKGADAVLRDLAERLDAPVITTVNGKGLMHAHPLLVPASPSLNSIRTMVAESDCLLAVGTEFGPTDFDMYDVGAFEVPAHTIRIDICADQSKRHPAQIALVGEASAVLRALAQGLEPQPAKAGAAWAEAYRLKAWDELPAGYPEQIKLLNAFRDAFPQSTIVGDSTQPIYAASLYYDHDKPGGWFNAATGYGALGFAIPAAIGAWLAKPNERIFCLTGDGGAQFTLPELMTAKDLGAAVTFLLWNNRGYQEIETSMEAAQVSVVGCDPTPPNFSLIAQACGLPYQVCTADPEALIKAVNQAETSGPNIIEIAL